MTDEPEKAEETKLSSRIVIEFDAPNSVVTNMHLEGVSYMQMFAAAKLLEIHGEGVYMNEQVQIAQREMATKRIATPRDHLPPRKVN